MFRSRSAADVDRWSYPEWRWRLIPLAVTLSLLAVLGLTARRIGRRPAGTRASAGLVALALLTLILATAWSFVTVWQAPGPVLPAAGPLLQDGLGSSINARRSGYDQPSEDAKLVEFLQENRGEARFLVATSSAATASPLILATGEPVMALHGFGSDQILAEQELKERVADGEVRFFLLPDLPQPGATQPRLELIRLFGPHAEDGGEQWVRRACREVPRALWSSLTGRAAGEPGLLLPRGLFQDCSARVTAGRATP